MSSNPSKWMTVAVFGTGMSAHAARTKLESEGIDCFIADENTVAMNWLYSAAVGGVKVQVHSADYHQARELLSVPAQAEVSEEPEGAPEAETAARFNSIEQKCPKCGLSHIRLERYHRGFAMLSWLLLAVPLPWPRRRMQCQGCGFEWKPEGRK